MIQRPITAFDTRFYARKNDLYLHFKNCVVLLFSKVAAGTGLSPVFVESTFNLHLVQTHSVKQCPNSSQGVKSLQAPIFPFFA